MALYFLHVQDDLADEDGQEFADDAAAMAEALRGARGIASADVMYGHLDLTNVVHCRRDDGKHVGSVTFAQAIDITTE